MNYEIGLAIYKKLPYDIQCIIDRMVHELKLEDSLEEIDACGENHHLSRVKSQLDLEVWYNQNNYDILNFTYGRDDTEFYLITRRKNIVYLSIINFNVPRAYDPFYQDEFEIYEPGYDLFDNDEYSIDSDSYSDLVSTFRIPTYNKKLFILKNFIRNKLLWE